MSTPEQTSREDIEKGLGRLNEAWQNLKKERESYQRVEDQLIENKVLFSLET